MCQFVSTKKVGDQHFYLTKADLKKKRFAEFKKYNLIWPDDIMGHGAIEFFYPELKGKGEHWECNDFSNPGNFPDCVVKNIKKGKFEGIGICLDILNEKGKEKYEKIQQPAWKEYKKIEQSAWKEYEKIQQSAREKYEKIQQSAREKYEKIQQPAWKEYEKIDQSAREKYEKIQQSAREKYEKIQQSAFWKIAKQAKYRKKEWK